MKPKDWALQLGMARRSYHNNIVKERVRRRNMTKVLHTL